MDKARVLPNGEFLAIYISSADAPWGDGIAKIDEDSNLIGSYLASAHYSFRTLKMRRGMRRITSMMPRQKGGT
jgi:hypothetical protein